MTAAAQPSDYGATGPASLRRAAVIVTVEARSRGSVAPGERIAARRILAVWDRMHDLGQLSDREWLAARHAASVWHASGLEARGAGRYGEGWGTDLGADPEARTGEDDWLDLMCALPLTQRRVVGALVRFDGMTGAIGRHPGAALSALQAGLQAVADLAGIDRNPDIAAHVLLDNTAETD